MGQVLSETVCVDGERVVLFTPLGACYPLRVIVASLAPMPWWYALLERLYWVRLPLGKRGLYPVCLFLEWAATQLQRVALRDVAVTSIRIGHEELLAERAPATLFISRMSCGLFGSERLAPHRQFMVTLDGSSHGAGVVVSLVVHMLDSPAGDRATETRVA
jgi:hypothetical protein